MKLLEIKCPKESTHLEALQGIIPPYYQDQIQWQLFTSACDMCYYFSYRPENKENPFAIVEVKTNHEKQEFLLEKCQKFYLLMCTMQPPYTWELKTKII